MFCNKIFETILRFFNFCTVKIKNSVYVDIEINSKNNCEDIINNGSNNVLKFLSEFIERKFEKKIIVFVEYFADERLEEYKKIAQKAEQNNVKLIFLRDHEDKKGWEKFRLLFKKFRFLCKSQIRLVNTGDTNLHGKLKKQYLFDLNYYISCKNDFLPGKNLRWHHLDGILTTSLLHSTVVSAQTGVKYDNCCELGFPRNDTLFQRRGEDKIFNWIIEELGYRPEKIIIYAPTYRDYETYGDDIKERHLFGYDIPDLENYLVKNKLCLIYKAHNLQKKAILKYPKGVINFHICYDFSFYDLMSLADCVITDYSSLGYDFMLLGRPLIYNLYDLDQYVEDRGVSYYPYEDFCPGGVVTNADEMMSELNRLLNNIDYYKEKRERLLKMFHKYSDNRSSERVIDYFSKKFGFLYEKD